MRLCGLTILMAPNSFRHWRDIRDECGFVQAASFFVRIQSIIGVVFFPGSDYPERPHRKAPAYIGQLILRDSFLSCEDVEAGVSPAKTERTAAGTAATTPIATTTSAM